MKEKAIIFKLEDIPAILSGQKTQERRLLHPVPAKGWAFEQPPQLGHITSKHPKRGRFGVFVKRGAGTDFPETDLIPCPFGGPGDRLWVQESYIHEPAEYEWSVSTSVPARPGNMIYRADSDPDGTANGAGWIPAPRMSREVSRITLEITNVRIQRLQHISEQDAVAEGISPHQYATGAIGTRVESVRCLHCGSLRQDHIGTAMVCRERSTCWNGSSARGGFAFRWDNRHGLGSWADNPWVWALEFRRID